jgi:hypothetical protein
LKLSIGCVRVNSKLGRIKDFVQRGNHEGYCIEWKCEREERGNVEITGFSFERALRRRGERKRHPAQGHEYLTLPGLPNVYA